MDIYKMKLHDTIELKCNGINYLITRVAGGWIYNHMRLDYNEMTTVFVKFDNEFMEQNKTF